MPNIKKWATNGFYLWLFLLPWQTRYFWGSSGSEFGRYSLFATDVLFVLWAAPFTLEAVRNFYNALWSKNLIAWAFVVFDIGALVSLIHAPDKKIVLYLLLRFVAAFSLIYLLPELKPDFKKASYALASAGIIQALFGLTEFFVQASWQSKWLGLSLHDPSVPGVSVIEFGLERWLRAYASFPHPNILGGFLAIALILLIARYLEIQKEEASPKEYLFVFIGTLITFAGLIVTFSRSAWLALAVALVILLARSFKQKDKTAQIALAKILIFFAAIFLFFFVLWRPLFLTRADTTNRLEQKSLNERIVYQNQAIKIIKQRPIIGIGLGNFTQTQNKLPDYSRQPVHNIFLLSLAEIGLVAIVFWALLIIGLLKQKGNIIFGLALGGLLLAGMFDHYLWSLPVGIWLFGLTLALTTGL